MTKTTSPATAPGDLSGLEVEVWFQCPSTADVLELAHTWNQVFPNGEVIAPPDGYCKLAIVWVHHTVEPDRDARADALAYGELQAEHVLFAAVHHDIPAEVYAIRVQPLDAYFSPARPASTATAAADAERVSA